jgi:hypothetical protein
MIKRNWGGNPSCYFCEHHETIDYLFVQWPTAKVIWCVVASCVGANNIPHSTNQICHWLTNWLLGGEVVYTLISSAVCWSIWKRRNKTCFDRKPLRNPIEIIIHAGAFLNYWVGLYKEELQEKIVEGVKTLVAAAH